MRVDVSSKSGHLLPISFPKHECGHAPGNSLEDKLGPSSYRNL